MPSNVKQAADLRGIDLEYNTLRGEILKRIELRQQIIGTTLTLAGIFLAVGLSQDAVALIYPPLAAFLAIAWAQNDFRIRDLACYIRENLEILPVGLHYETYVQMDRAAHPKLGAWRYVVISHGGIILFTQLMAIGIALLRTWPVVLTPLMWILLAVDVSTIVIVLWILRESRR